MRLCSLVTVAVTAVACGACYTPSYDATRCGAAQACPDGYTCTPTGYCAVCGDGLVENGEECDDANLDDSDDCHRNCRRAACGDFVIRSSPAIASDAEECDVGGEETANCDGDCTAVRCGDHRVNAVAGEVCDDGGAVGSDGCRGDCRSDESCGNGVLDDHLSANPQNNLQCLTGELQGTGCAEVCDDGNQLAGDGCSPNCLSDEECRNGILDPGETCDDGNLVDADSCRNDCHGGGGCGNGRVEQERGEQCDTGPFETATCDRSIDPSNPQNCTVAMCGDRYVNSSAGEQCDDGNVINTDECVSCRAAVCGDGATRAGVEQCDDGNANANDLCRNDCTVP